jgi:hypothetical protein
MKSEHSLIPEERERIAESLAAPVEIREKPKRLDISRLLEQAKPSGLKPITRPSTPHNTRLTGDYDGAI